MEDVKGKMDNDKFYNRNLIRTEEHLSISVNNDHSNLDALNKSQKPKIEPSNTKSTTKSDRIYSGLYEDPRLQCKKSINQRINCTKPLIKNSQKITEQKNEILSRTFSGLIKIKRIFKSIFYLILIFLIFNTQCGVDSAPLETNEISLTKLKQELFTNNRTFSYHQYGKEHSLAKRHTKTKNQSKMINKNCKEYDITSRAYLADLIFEGTARSRSSFTSGRFDVTFVIQRILKQKQKSNNLLKPKSQIRLNFGGKAYRKLSHSLLHDCPMNSITNSKIVRAKINVGQKYYVFADLFGPMNYTAKGEPIVINKRNLKSIRSVVSRNREKPPRVRGLQNLTRTTNSELSLTCQIVGRPVPRITWYKDGHPLIPSSHVNITYYRKNSTVEIKSLNLKDGGVYECRGTSVMGKSDSMSAYVNISQFYTENTTSSTTTDSDWPMHAEKCEVDAFCLNGGKCRFISSIGEHMCICEDGFKGARCENKDVSTKDWNPETPEGNASLPQSQRLFRRRIRGHTIPLTDVQLQYVAFMRSSGEANKVRHWFGSQWDRQLREDIKHGQFSATNTRQ